MVYKSNMSGRERLRESVNALYYLFVYIIVVTCVLAVCQLNESNLHHVSSFGP